MSTATPPHIALFLRKPFGFEGDDTTAVVVSTDAPPVVSSVAAGVQCPVDRVAASVDNAETLAVEEAAGMAGLAASGINVVCVATGPALSGKSRTLFGDGSIGSNGFEGVLSSFVSYLTKTVCHRGDDALSTISFAVMEVASEQVRDLVNLPAHEKKLKVKQHPRLGPVVDGLSWMTYALKDGASAITSTANQLIADARDVRCMNLSPEDTLLALRRTHFVVQVKVRRPNVDGGIFSCSSFVDCASFERSDSLRLLGSDLPPAESAPASHLSMNTLTRVLQEQASAAWERSWRGSQLTHLLCPSYTGGSSMVFVLAHLPASAGAASPDVVRTFLEHLAAIRRTTLKPISLGDPLGELVKALTTEIDDIKLQLKLIDEGKPTKDGVSKPECLQQLVDVTEMFQEVTESPDEQVAKTKAIASKREAAKKKWLNDTNSPYTNLRRNGIRACAVAAPRVVLMSRDAASVGAPAVAFDLPTAVCEGEYALKFGPDDACQAVIKGHKSAPLTAAAVYCEFLVDPVATTVCLKPSSPNVNIRLNGRAVAFGTTTAPLSHDDRVVIGDVPLQMKLPGAWAPPKPDVGAVPFASQPTTQLHAELLKEWKAEHDAAAAANANGDVSEFRRRRANTALAAARLTNLFPAASAPNTASSRWTAADALAEIERVEAEDAKAEKARQEAAAAAADPRSRSKTLCADDILRQLNSEGFDDAEEDEDPAREEATDDVDEDGLPSPKKAALAARSRAQSMAVPRHLPHHGRMRSATTVGGRAGDDGEAEDFDDIIKIPTKGITLPPVNARPPFDPVADLLDDLDRMMAEHLAKAKAARKWNSPLDVDKPQLAKPRAYGAAKADAKTHTQPELGDLRVVDSGTECSKVFKLRTRRNMFNRGGYEPVHLLLCGRVLQYYPAGVVETTAPLGACYIYGATIQGMTGTIEGMEYCLRIDPTCPRKGTKDACGPTEENALFLSFESEPERDKWLNLLTRASNPPPVEPLQVFFGNDIPLRGAKDRAPLPPAVLDRNDARIMLSKRDMDLVDEFLAMDDTAFKFPPLPTPHKIIEELTDPSAAHALTANADEILRNIQIAATNTHDAKALLRQLAVAADDGDLPRIDAADDYWRLRLSFFHQYARTSTEPQSAAKIAKRRRAWLVNAFAETIELVDVPAKISFVFHLTQVVSTERLQNNPTGLKIVLFHHGYLAFTEYLMTHADRERFLDALTAARPALRLWAPRLVPNGQSDAIREFRAPKGLTVKKVPVEGSALLRVANVLDEGLSIWTGTVNVNGVPFESSTTIGRWIPLGNHDLYAVTLQGVMRDAVSSPDHFADFMARYVLERFDCEYTVLKTVQLADIALVLVVRRAMLPKLGNVEASTCPSEIEALAGERGGVGIAVRYLNTSIAFIGVHLPGQPQRLDLRRYVCAEVLSNLQLGDKDCDVCAEYDHVIVLGDFNFSLSPKTLPQLQEALIKADPGTTEGKAMIHQAFKACDTLTAEREARRILYGFAEAEINFAPTAPYDPKDPAAPLWITAPDKTPQGNGTTRYSGRILYKSLRPGDLQCLSYEPYFNWVASGHRPLSATFALRTVRPVSNALTSLPFPPSPKTANKTARYSLYVSDIKMGRPLDRPPSPADADVVLRVSSPGHGLFEPLEVSDPTAVTSGQWVYHDLTCLCQTHVPELLQETSLSVSVLTVPRGAVRGSGASGAGGGGQDVKVLLSGVVPLTSTVMEAALQAPSEITFSLQRGAQFITACTLVLRAELCVVNADAEADGDARAD